MGRLFTQVRQLQRHLGAGGEGRLAAAVYLGTYPDSGAFFDLVRPDGMLMALPVYVVTAILVIPIGLLVWQRTLDFVFCQSDPPMRDRDGASPPV